MNVDLYKTYRTKCKLLLAEQGELKNYNELNNYENFKELFSENDFKEIVKDKNRRQKKRYRVDSKFLQMLRLRNVLDDSIIVFGTLTLKNEILDLKENTYIRKIHNYLKSHYEMVILNKDYGSTTEREHYHFIGLTREPLTYAEQFKSKKGFVLYNLDKQDYNLGFEPVLEIVNVYDNKKVRNYLLKLNNHCTKESTKNTRFRVLFSPMVKVFFEYGKVY